MRVYGKKKLIKSNLILTRGSHRPKSGSDNISNSPSSGSKSSPTPTRASHRPKQGQTHR